MDAQKALLRVLAAVACLAVLLATVVYDVTIIDVRLQRAVLVAGVFYFGVAALDFLLHDEDDRWLSRA